MARLSVSTNGLKDAQEVASANALSSVRKLEWVMEATRVDIKSEFADVYQNIEADRNSTNARFVKMEIAFVALRKVLVQAALLAKCKCTGSPAVGSTAPCSRSSWSSSGCVAFQGSDCRSMPRTSGVAHAGGET